MALEDLMGPEEEERHWREMAGIGAMTGTPVWYEGTADEYVSGALKPTSLLVVPFKDNKDGKQKAITAKNKYTMQNILSAWKANPAAWDVAFGPAPSIKWIEEEAESDEFGNFLAPFERGTRAREKYRNRKLRKIGTGWTYPVAAPPPQPEPAPITPPAGAPTIVVRGEHSAYALSTPAGDGFVSFVRLDPVPPAFAQRGALEGWKYGRQITDAISAIDAEISAMQADPHAGARGAYGAVAMPSKITVTRGAVPSGSTIKSMEAATSGKLGAKVYPVSKGGCFIATAAYGTPLDPRIDVLRRFRDGRLMPDPLGRALVGGYYALSPPVAHAVSMSKTLRGAVRALITPLVGGR